MSETAVAKTLLKQAQENLKKAEAERYNEKIRIEFGNRCKELLEATKAGDRSISFDVSFNDKEAVALTDLFVKEGLCVSVYTRGRINNAYLTNSSYYQFYVSIPST
jgi:hypothetical protein